MFIMIIPVNFRKYTLYIHFLSLFLFFINAISGKIPQYLIDDEETEDQELTGGLQRKVKMKSSMMLSL